jgi:plasmid stabilization system protein ParE
MKRYLLTRSAKKDRDEIWLYIAQKSYSLTPAERLMSQTMATWPQTHSSGDAVEEIDEKGRCFPAGEYIVYYREESSRIAITHVFHSKRQYFFHHRASHIQRPRDGTLEER